MNCVRPSAILPPHGRLLQACIHGLPVQCAVQFSGDHVKDDPRQLAGPRHSQSNGDEGRAPRLGAETEEKHPDEGKPVQGRCRAHTSIMVTTQSSGPAQVDCCIRGVASHGCTRHHPRGYRWCLEARRHPEDGEVQTRPPRPGVHDTASAKEHGI